ncbi:MAG: hypothetical protein ABIU97_07365 [Dehalococcoidia bacterium]
MHATNDPKDYPVVSYRVTGEAESQVEGNKRLVVEIQLDRTLNGYAGSTVSLEVPVASAAKDNEPRVLEAVKYICLNQTGHDIPGKNFSNETVRAVAPKKEEKSVPVMDSAPVAGDVTPPAGAKLVETAKEKKAREAKEAKAAK